MRGAIPLVLAASPALAHHETIVIATLPVALPALVACIAALVAVWVRWRGGRR